LDPEQNGAFNDLYLNVPFDLSKTLFIATANTLDSIPAPLLDRMEIVRLAGYTYEEKLHIARKHLLPKQIAAHGLPKSSVEIDDESLMYLITNYTREAGVRSLERELAAICREVTMEMVQNLSGSKLTPRIVAKETIEIFLGVCFSSRTSTHAV
jgi:ATP-dependent Lon protease